MDKCKSFIKENKEEIVVFVVCAFYFFLQIVNTGIATHDELLNIYKVRLGILFKDITWERWGSVFFNVLPTYVQALSQSFFVYRLFTMFGIICSCLAFAWFISKMTNRKTSWLFLFLFFLFAQIELEHDGLFAFCFTYQMNACYVFLGLGIYCDYLTNRRKQLLFSSAIFYLMSAMAYEAFVPYGLLFFWLALEKQIADKKMNIWQLIRDLWLHALLVSIYVVSYFGIGLLSGVQNADTTISTHLKISEVLIATWKLAIGLFPLNYNEYTTDELISKCFNMSIENLLRWIIVLGISYITCKVIKRSERIRINRYIIMSVFCFSGMIISGCLVAVTEKFINWICYGGVKSFGVSYYSYFFIVAWIAITLVFIYHVVPIKKLFLVVVFGGIALTTQATAAVNEGFIERFSLNESKYELWNGLVSSDYFSSIDHNAVVYAPEFTGIHYDINTMAVYANNISGLNISVTNKWEEIDFTRPVYFLDWDYENELYYVSKIDQNWITNEIYVYSLQDIGEYGMIVDRDDTLSSAPLFIDGQIFGQYGTTIVSRKTNSFDCDMLVNCQGMIANTFGLYKPASSYDSCLIKTGGIYAKEDWGRWAQKECYIQYENDKENTKIITLNLLIATPGEENSLVTFSCGEVVQDRIVSGPTRIKLELPVALGKNVISISSKANDLVVSNGDIRDLNIQVFEMSLIVNGEEINLNNLQ